MLLKLLQGRKPTHVVLSMDAGTSGREAVDASYKAQRKPMPEDMPPQIERIMQIVGTLGMPLFMAEGYEADDAMATLIRKIRNDPTCGDCKIYMCTKDKDLDQLIDDRCVMYDIQTNEEINAAGLLAKKGYLPTQARDVLALTGDTVDNIPGVPGVGPKTAAKWIAQYGSIDNLIARKEEIGGKIGEAFRANLHVLENSQKLVELQFDVPIPAMDWETAKVHPEKLPQLAPIFQELGFSRMTALLEQVVNQYRDMIPAGVKVAKIAATPSAPPPPRPVKERIAETKKKVAEIRGGLFDQVADDADVTAEPAGGDEEAAPAADGETAPEVAGLQPVVGEYVLVNTPEKLDTMLATLREQIADSPNKWLAVDTETDALGSMASNICGISLSAKIGTGYYVAIKGAIEETLDPDVVRKKLGPLLADPAVRKVGQNIKYDLNALRAFGLPVANVDFDTMIASYVIDSARLSHGMDALAADYLGLRPIPITDLIGKGASQVSFADVPLSRAAHYAAEDADVTLRLAHALHPLLAQQGRKSCSTKWRCRWCRCWRTWNITACLSATRRSAKSSRPASNEKHGRLSRSARSRRQPAASTLTTIRLASLPTCFSSQLKLPIIKKTKTGPSTDITVLEKLADKHPVPALIVGVSAAHETEKHTYLDTLAELPSKKTGRVHSHFNQTGAETGRLSSSDPNLQNIPVKTELGREIRRAFIAAGECAFER